MIRRLLAVGAVTTGGVALLGAPLGLLWWAIAPRPEVTVVAEGETAPFPVAETMFASEGHYALIMLAVGLIGGYVGYLVQYRFSARHLVDLRLTVLLGMVCGAFLGSVLAWRIGEGLDSAAFASALAAAEPGATIRAGLRLHATSMLLVWPFLTVLQYGLFDAVSVLRDDLPGAPALDPADDPDDHDEHGTADPAGAAAPPVQGARPAR